MSNEYNTMENHNHSCLFYQTVYRVEKPGERRSRILRKERGVVSENCPEQDADETRLRYDQLGIRASRLKLPYYRSVAVDGER